MEDQRSLGLVFDLPGLGMFTIPAAFAVLAASCVDLSMRRLHVDQYYESLIVTLTFSADGISKADALPRVTTRQTLG